MQISALSLQLNPSFATHQFKGTAELTLDWIDPNAKELILDTHKLDIEKIEVIQ